MKKFMGGLFLPACGGCFVMLSLGVILFFLAGLCPVVAMDGDDFANQEKKIKLGTGINIVTGEGREEALPDREYYEYERGMMLVSEENERGKWYFSTSNNLVLPRPESAWMFLAEASQIDLDLVIRGANPDGYCYIRFVGESVRQIVFKVPDEVKGAEMDATVLLVQTPVTIKAVSSKGGEIDPADVTYEFLQGDFCIGASANKPSQYYEYPASIRGGEECYVFWTKRGKKNVKVKWRERVVKEFEVEVFEFVREQLLFAVNANDSNRDEILDLKQERLRDPATGDLFNDRDLKQVFFGLIGEDPHARYALGVGEIGRGIVSHMCRAGLYVKIAVPDNVEIYNSLSKEEAVVPLFMSLKPGHQEALVRYANNLFAEAKMQRSKKKITLEVEPNFQDVRFKPGMCKSSVATVDLILLHIRMRYRFSNAEIKLDASSPVNQVENPAVIHIPTPEDNELSNFSVKLVEAEDVPEDTDWIWWRVRPYENPTIPYRPGEELPVEPGVAICSREYGTKISIEGVREGYVTVEVGVKGNDVPYLTKNCYVGRKIRFPFCFKLLNAGEYGDLLQLKGLLADATKISNVILRQAGVELVAVPENATERSFADRCKAEISFHRREGEVEVYDPALRDLACGNFLEKIKIRSGGHYFIGKEMLVIPSRFENCKGLEPYGNNPYILKFKEPDILEMGRFRLMPLEGEAGNPVYVPWYVGPKFEEMRRRYDLEGAGDAEHGIRCYDVEDWILRPGHEGYDFVNGVIPGAINLHVVPWGFTERELGVGIIMVKHHMIPLHRILTGSPEQSSRFILEEGTGEMLFSREVENELFFQDFKDVMCVSVSARNILEAPFWKTSADVPFIASEMVNAIMRSVGLPGFNPRGPRDLPIVEYKRPRRQIMYSTNNLDISLGQAMMVRSTKFHEPLAPQ